MLVADGTALTIRNSFRPGVLNFDMFSASLDFFGTNLYVAKFVSRITDIHTMVHDSINVSAVEATFLA